MKPTILHLSLPKYGNTENENEDSYKIGEPTKYAIADGATESSYSKEWSQLLVDAFNKNSFSTKNIQKTIEKISAKWKKNLDGRNFAWYAQQKMEQGAFATFCGVCISFSKHELEVVAVGDCNLFHIRSNELLYSFPMEKYEEFGNTPLLFSTNLAFQIDFSKDIKRQTKSYEDGDILVLATDAMAAWLVKYGIAQVEKWCKMSQNDFKNDFCAWLNEKRACREIKNDDTTILIIQ